jgi:predicted Zn-dependent peptidase
MSDYLLASRDPDEIARWKAAVLADIEAQRNDPERVQLRRG